MAKRTIEFEDVTGPFTVKLKGDTEGNFTILMYDNRPVSKPSRLHMDLDDADQVESLGMMLQNMAENLSQEVEK